MKPNNPEKKEQKVVETNPKAVAKQAEGKGMKQSECHSCHECKESCPKKG
jgi:NAD-dependent dihydropyrimidine dehydrogenase PreA subunit